MSNKHHIHPITPWIVWGLAAAFFFGHYFIRVAPSLILPELMRDFSITADVASKLLACFTLTYTLMQTPVGILVDRYGCRLLLSVAIFIAAAATFAFAAAETITQAFIARALFGASAAFAFVSALKLATAWFPPHKMSLIVGLTQALGMLGGAFVSYYMSKVIILYGWRFSVSGIAVGLVILGVAIALFVRNSPKALKDELDHKTKFSDDDLVVDHKSGIKTVLCSRYTWLTAFFAAFIFAPTYILTEGLGTEFIKTVYNLNSDDATNLISVMFIGWALASPLAGWLADIIGRRKVALISASLCTILIYIFIYITNLSFSSLVIISFLYGVANTGLICAYTTAGELHPKHGTAFSISIANMFTNLLGLILSPLVGYALDKFFWDGTMINGLPFYTKENFQSVFMLLPICALLAIVCAWFNKETLIKVKKHGH